MTNRCILACAFAFSLAAPAPAREPLSQGKPLSYWLLLLRERELRIEPPGNEGNALGAGPLQTSIALRELGADARAAVPNLLAWFREGDSSAEGQRARAQYLVSALHDVGCTDRSLAPLLIGLTSLGHDDLAQAALQALKPIDPETHAVLTRQRNARLSAHFLEEFQAADPHQRLHALAGLAELDPVQAQIGLPFLNERLLDPVAAGSTRPEESLDPTPILQQMGVAARSSAPLLEYRYRQEGKASFMIALANVAPEKAGPLLRRESADARKAILHLLAQSRTLQPTAAPLFADFLADRSVSLDAATALLRLDPGKAKKALPLFAEALNDLDPETQ